MTTSLEIWGHLHRIAVLRLEEELLNLCSNRLLLGMDRLLRRLLLRLNIRMEERRFKSKKRPLIMEEIDRLEMVTEEVICLGLREDDI
mmetsp:Transcript_19597/g.3208  ORF Transcript_19597/g.3208 Transcript_19597/m.3208 type:complete len:88 (-) Transcript_19597:45-308(-)